MWGYENFVSAIEFEKELKIKYPKLDISNSIQTNGSLLNDLWIDFFSENNFDIGISLDGPDEINFHKGTEGSSKIVLDNIQKLYQKNVNLVFYLSLPTTMQDGLTNTMIF